MWRQFANARSTAASPVPSESATRTKEHMSRRPLHLSCCHLSFVRLTSTAPSWSFAASKGTEEEQIPSLMSL